MDTAHDELVARASSGDRDALSTLLDHFGRDVASKLDGDIAPQWRPVLDIEDVMQVTYLEAFLEIDRLAAADARSFLAWLTRIARNNLRDAVRGLASAKRPQPRRRVRFPAGDRSHVALVELLTGKSATPSRDAASHEARTSLEAALGRLPQDYARVIRLYDLEGHTGDETAHLMSRSRGTVYLMRVRALERLRDLLGSGSRFFTDAR